VIKPEDFQSELISLAIIGTLSVLKATAKTPTVKRVVITSSIVGFFVPSTYMFDLEMPEVIVFDHESKTTLEPGPYPWDFHAYIASKVSVLNATAAFVRDNKPSFEMTNIHRSFVIVKHELITDAT
jgi:hypothetical protein